jgi:hypothetical protein
LEELALSYGQIRYGDQMRVGIPVLYTDFLIRCCKLRVFKGKEQLFGGNEVTTFILGSVEEDDVKDADFLLLKYGKFDAPLNENHL